MIAEGALPSFLVLEYEVDMTVCKVVNRVEAALFPDVAEGAVWTVDDAPVSGFLAAFPAPVPVKHDDAPRRQAVAYGLQVGK